MKLLKKIEKIIYRLNPVYRLNEKIYGEMATLNSIANNLKIIKRILCTRDDINNEKYLNRYNYKNEMYYFYDNLISDLADLLAEEVLEVNEKNYKKRPYYFKNLDFKEDDIVIDIGANLGFVSIYLAKKYPFLKIYAFEPAKRTYELFLENIKINEVQDNIIAENLAVTSDGRDTEFLFSPSSSGNSMLKSVSHDRYFIDSNNIWQTYPVKSIALDEIFDKYKIEKCKLLKIDCEGAEKEIFYNSKILSKIENIRGELHFGEKNSEIIEYLSNYVDKTNMKFMLI